MNDKEATDRIAAFTQLDAETVSSQILPYVKSMTDARSLRGHLLDLIGPGQAQNAFMDAFVASRFPSAAPPATAPLKPTAPASTSSKAKAGPARRGTGSAAATTTTTTTKNQSSKQPVDLSKAFGNSGAVYVKGKHQDPSDFFNNKKSGQHSQQSSASARPAAASSGPVADSSRSQVSPSNHPRTGNQEPAPFTSKAASGTADPSSSGFVLAPTEDMKALDAEIAELTTECAPLGGALSTSTGAKERRFRPRTCYCQGRVHPLFKQRPLCLHCGLLLCSLNLPTPLQPESPCPSCGKVLLTQGERSALLSSLLSRREDAERQALIKAERVRAAREEQRRRAGEQAAGSRGATESLFPELSGGDAAARQKALEVDYALGRKQRGASEADLGGLRTAPARTGARVLTIGKKGKVTVGSTAKKKAKKATTSSEAPKDTASKAKGGADTAEVDPQARLDDHAGGDAGDDDDAAFEEEAAAQEEDRRLGFVPDPAEAVMRNASFSGGASQGARPWFNPYLSLDSGANAGATVSSDGASGFAYMPADVRAGFEEVEGQS